MGTTIIDIQNVSYVRDNKRILASVTASIERGSFTTLIGPNGAGKSTLIKLIIGTKKPTSGTIAWLDTARIGYVPQKVNLSPSIPLRVKDFLNLRSHNKNSITHLIEELEIGHLLDSQVSVLSGGEFQKVMLCFALAIEPTVLILDEPLAGVDVDAQKSITDHLVKLNKQEGLTIIMVSHDHNLVFANSTYVICLNNHLHCCGKPTELADEVMKGLQQKPHQEAPLFYSHTKHKE